MKIISGYDVVIDGTDNFESRYLIGDTCEILGKPWIFGSIHRFEGQVSTFNFKGGPNYRDLFPTPPPPELAPNCSEAGVLGILPGIIGTIQATEAIKIILGIGNCLSGELLVIDALTMDFRKLGFSSDSERERVTSLEKKQEIGFSEIGAKEFSRRRNEGWTPFLLDVRRSHEEQISSIRGTDSRIMHLEIPSKLEELPSQGDIVVYCRSGQRSDAVARFIVDSGICNGTIYNLLGGINAWADEVDPSLVKY